MVSLIAASSCCHIKCCSAACCIHVGLGEGVSMAVFSAQHQLSLLWEALERRVFSEE